MVVYNSWIELCENFNDDVEFECEGEYFHLHHRVLDRGYFKKNKVEVKNYSGRFGEGIEIHTHIEHGCYHQKAYYVREK